MNTNIVILHELHGIMPQSKLEVVTDLFILTVQLNLNLCRFYLLFLTLFPPENALPYRFKVLCVSVVPPVGSFQFTRSLFLFQTSLSHSNNQPDEPEL